MLLLLRHDIPARRVRMIAPMMLHERSAQNILAPAHRLAVDLIRQRRVKPVIPRPQRNDRLPRIHILHNQLPLRHRQRQQAREKDHEVRRSELLQTGDVMLFERLPFLRINRHRRVHLAPLVHREKHRAIEPMMRAENFRHHRHGLLAAILLVRRNQHHPLAFDWAFSARIRQPLRPIVGTEGGAG